MSRVVQLDDCIGGMVDTICVPVCQSLARPLGEIASSLGAER